jgi:HEAT repeat protein
MNRFLKTLIAAAVLLPASTGLAQSDATVESEQLKIAALEALIAAPPERALPIVEKVLSGDGSDELKTRALFILSQIDLPAAHAQLVQTARSQSGELQREAVRMIGISGNRDAIAGLSDIYASGDADVREAVLEAYLIADDSDALFQIATNTQDPDEFESAAEMLAAMGAMEQLRALRDRGDMSEVLVDAYAIAGDIESLHALASDSSNPQRQRQAVQALGIAGGPEVDAILVDIYRTADTDDLRQAALEGMLIAGNEDDVLELFRASRDAEEKRKLLEVLVMIGGDTVWDVIDATLDDQQ